MKWELSKSLALGRPEVGIHDYGTCAAIFSINKSVPFADKCSNSGNKYQYYLNILRSFAFHSLRLRLCLASHLG